MHFISNIHFYLFSVLQDSHALNNRRKIPNDRFSKKNKTEQNKKKENKNNNQKKTKQTKTTKTKHEFLLLKFSHIWMILNNNHEQLLCSSFRSRFAYHSNMSEGLICLLKQIVYLYEEMVHYT